MAALTFNETLVKIIDEPMTRVEVESALADVLHGMGYVRDSYRQAILDREESFPTGSLRARSTWRFRTATLRT